HTGDHPLQRELTETDTAEAELAQHRPRAAAPLAPAHHPRLELRGALGPLDPTGLRHPRLLRDALRQLAAERPSELAQERHGQIIATRSGHDRNVHPVDLLDLV